MKTKFFLLAIFAVSFGVARANTDPEPSHGKGKKDDLMGMVYQGDKKPIRDVNVTAYLASKKEKTVVTSEDGSYAFDELKPGTYKFVFEKAGFKKVVKEKVIVRTDEAFQLDIEMIGNNTFDLIPSPLHFTDF